VGDKEKEVDGTDSRENSPQIGRVGRKREEMILSVYSPEM